MLQKMLQRMAFFFSHFNHDLVKKFKIMDIYERMIVIWLLVVFIIVWFTPLMSVSSNEVFDQWVNYLFLLTQPMLWKSFILIEWWLILSLLWFFHNKFKTFIVENLWFQSNNYLFLSFVILVAMTGFITMWEIVNLFTVYTMVISLTPLYYIALIILVLVIALCIYMSFFQSNKYFKGHVVWYHGKRETKDNDDSWSSLFDSIQHDD